MIKVCRLRDEICTECSYNNLFVIRVVVSLYSISRYHVGGAFCSAALSSLM